MPRTTIHHDPYVHGVTGLETYLWADPQGPITSSASIRGYPVTCTAAPYEWRWRTGDGAGATSGHAGGPPPAQAVTHTYETKGGYELSVNVLWALVTNYGTGVVSVPSSRPYQVIEVRSVLTG